MKMLLLTLAVISSSAFAGDWSCPEISEHNSLKYTSHCNNDGSITFKNIHLVTADVHAKIKDSAHNAQAFCSLHNMHVINHRAEQFLISDPSHLVNISEISGEIHFSPEAHRGESSISRITCM